MLNRLRNSSDCSGASSVGAFSEVPLLVESWSSPEPLGAVELLQAVELCLRFFCLELECYLLHGIRGIEKAFDLFQRKSRLLIKPDELDAFLLQLTVEQMPVFVFPEGATSPAFS